MAGPCTEKGFVRRVWRIALVLAAVSGGRMAAAQAPPPLSSPTAPALGAAAGAAPAASPGLPSNEELVVEVRIEGNQFIAKEKILPHIRTRAGRPYDEELIEEDVRQLTRTRLFVDIKTFSQRVPGGRIVVFRVSERATLREVRFIGYQKVKEKVLRKEVDLKVGDAADPSAVEEGRRKLEDFYRSKGFSKVRITVIEGNKVGDRKAIYLINEGIKQRVLWTRFEGNTIASDDRLRTQIQSKPGILWIFRGEVDRKQIEEDINRLTAYYRGLGFFDARIGRELEFSDNQNWLTLTFVIHEGPRYKVRNVSFVGNTKFTTEEFVPLLNLKDHQDFNQSRLDKDKSAIQDKYGSIGYVFADVKADTRFLDEPGTLDLVYHISEGDRYRVGKINVEIKGENPHTRITTVLNRVSLNPGDIVDIRELRKSERRLRASGLFMVDPASGVEPKIVFTPPEGEDDQSTQMARRPKSPPSQHGVRGQSPDLVPDGPWRWSELPDSRTGDRHMELTVPCRWNTPDGRTPTYLEPTPRGRYETQRPLGGPRAEPPMIVRGQYSADAGWQTPQFPARSPWANQPSTTPATGSRSSATSYGPQPGAAPAYTTTPSYGPTGSAPAAAVAPAPYSPPAYAPSAGLPAAAPSASPAYAVPPYAATPNGGYAAAASGPAVGNQVQGAPDPYFTGGAAPVQPAPGTGLFSENSPFLSPDGEATRDLPLNVLASETTTGRLMFGVGVNSDAGLVGSVVIDEQNFDWTRFPRSFEEIRTGTAWRGAGQRFRFEAFPGTEVQRYMVTFQEPYLLDTRVGLGLSGFYFDRRYREWTEQRLGGRMSLQYQFTHDLSGSIAYRGARVKIYDPVVRGVPDLEAVLGDNDLHGFSASLTHDTRDNAFLATQGHLIELMVEQVVGSFEYPRAEVDMQQYFLLRERPDGSGRHVLSLSGRFGWSGDDTPIYDRFYAGGFSTIRGFDFRGVSPRDPTTGIAVGGDVMALASVQYLFPITADDMLRGVVFCDTGTVQRRIDEWDEAYRVAPGLGLRITIPAMGPAPIALDFAFPVHSQPGDEKEVFSFFIGLNR